MAGLWIKDTRIVSSQGVAEGSVKIENGLISEVTGSTVEKGSHVIDGKGLYLLPGVIDPHVHFRDPGFTHKENLHTGSRACAAGGVTSFFEMPNTHPPAVSRESIAAKKKLAAAKSLVNYNFLIGATADNIEELNTVRNVPGIKIFMGASGGDLPVSKPDELDKVFANGRRLITVHAEDESILDENRKKYAGSDDVHDHYRIRSAGAALSATRLAVGLSLKYQRRLHILHLSTRDEVIFLEKEKTKGPITVELCPQHFILKAPDDYDRLGTYALLNPPVRSSEHGRALWQALENGTIDFIASDHAPHIKEEKEQPFGMPGVETSLPLMLDRVNRGLCSLPDVARWMSESVAAAYRIRKRGRIQVGCKADLVLVDMKKKQVVENNKLQTECGWSPYTGFELTGWPVMTFVNGHPVYREGDIDASETGEEIEIDESHLFNGLM